MNAAEIQDGGEIETLVRALENQEFVRRRLAEKDGAFAAVLESALRCPGHEAASSRP